MHAQTTPAEPSDPIAAFLTLETRLAGSLVAALAATLTALRAVLSGSQPLTSQALRDGADLLAGGVPAQWDALWEGPDAPLEYVAAVFCRCAPQAQARGAGADTVPARAAAPHDARACRAKAVVAMHAEHAGGRFLRAPVALHHFFSPGTFLSTVRQAAARQLGAPTDSLALFNSWEPADFAGRCPVTVTVTGLVMEGAKFDGRSVELMAASDAATALLRPVTFAWLPAHDPSGARTASVFGDAAVEVPVYASVMRQRALFNLQLPAQTDAMREQLVLAGAAAFLVG